MSHNWKVAVSQTIAPSEARNAESRGGKSELRRAVRRVTPGQGNLTESGTENIPLPRVRRTREEWWRSSRTAPPLHPKCAGHAEVRVKRCGKSAPRRR